MSWACDMPAELLCHPVGLVVLSGLDLVYNAVHKAIWDSFSNNRRADRVPLKFISFGIDHEYPKCRAKRTSYEWYIPKGILKSSWMTKHLNQVPAVVVIFFDLDWDEQMWKERQMECATRVEIVRNSLSGRGTKVCMVLIQKNAPLPPGEDLIAAERAASLCSACELSAKALFVLPLTDHLLGYTIRLENAFFEMSQLYYHTETRRVKSHKDFINKTTHHLLFVRHQFKIAFFNELKQDLHTALKHYKLAYGDVLELRMLDTNLLEVKTIAGFVNYKICRLSFQVHTPLDAIAQFRKHIDFFKSKIGIADLNFEHCAWMAKQFQIFGDLFDEAIKLGGLTAIQTQHPGFYYQQSAYHSLSRKQLASKLQQTISNAAAWSPDVLQFLNSLDYYGQRPWRQGHQSIEPPDSTKEKDGILALQSMESKVDHSWIIIPLLGSAVAQFKKYKSPRMKRYLMVQMGEEYFYAREYARALAILTRVTFEYRHERWWCLLTSVLTTQLRCAYLIANIQDYITVCIELVGRYTDNSLDDKTRIFGNLLRVLARSQPDAEPGCAIESSTPAWTNSLSTGGTEPLKVEMANIAAFIECKAAFANDSFPADNPIVVNVYLKSSGPAPITFGKLYLTFNNTSYNNLCILSATDAVTLEPNKVTKYAFSFVGEREDIGRAIEIKTVCLEWSNGQLPCVCLHWTGAGGDVVAPLQQLQSPRSPPDMLVWDELTVRPVTRLSYRDSSALDIDVRHSPPGLINEMYHYAVAVTNNELADITDVSISFGFKDTSVSGNAGNQSTTISSEAGQPNSKLTLKCGERLTRDFHSKTSTSADLILVVSVSYQISVVVDTTTVVCHCQKEQNVCLSVVNPLGFDFQLYNTQYDTLDLVNTDIPFILLTDIHSLTTWPLRLLSSRLQLSEGVSSTSTPDANQSQLSNAALKSSADHVGECYLLSISNDVSALETSTDIPLGQYIVTVQRDDSTDSSFELIVSLPTVNVVRLPVCLQLSMPTDISVESLMTITYSLQNNTDILHDVDISVESTEAFMFAGHRQVHVRVLPHSVHQLTYSLVPLMSGNVSLPKLHVTLPRCTSAESLSAAIYRMVPNTVFVQPRKRSVNQVISTD